MIEDPFCFAGSEISAIPVLGPLERSRRSLHIFERLSAAVLRVEESELLKNSDVCEVKVADSDKTLVGEPAIAIGNAKGMGLASSYGVVSVDSEHITMNSEKDNAAVSFRVMRVDTAVNPGNSGGGLFNENGELIGIVNAKIIDSSVEGIGYAIPSNVAVAVADNIIDNCFEKDCKSVQRCMMGVMITISNSRAEFDSQTGRVTLKEDVVVHEITEGSMVKGILEVGDIIKGIAVGDKSLEVTRQHQVIDFMLNVRVGDSVTLTVQRNGEIVNKTLEITEAYITAY